MSRDSGPVEPLEQRCIEPGHWLIEGYDVIKTNSQVTRGFVPNWAISLFGEHRANVRTLSDARDWIREKRF